MSVTSVISYLNRLLYLEYKEASPLILISFSIWPLFYHLPREKMKFDIFLNALLRRKYIVLLIQRSCPPCLLCFHSPRARTGSRDKNCYCCVYCSIKIFNNVRNDYLIDVNRLLFEYCSRDE